MTKELKCKSCSFTIRDEDVDELVTMVQQHNKNMHKKSTPREDIMKAARDV